MTGLYGEGISLVKEAVSNNRAQAARFFKWVFIFAFFVLVPPIVLFAARFMMSGLSSPDSEVVLDFSSDLSMILLSVYLGALGSLVSYIFARTAQGTPSEPMITIMAKLLLGSSVAVATFFLLRTGILVKFIYPKALMDKSELLMTYHPIAIFSFLSGLSAPAIVKRMQTASLLKGKSETTDNADK